MRYKKSPRKSILQILIALMTGGGIFFIYYAGINNQHFSYKLNKSFTPQEILDRSVNTSGVKETKSIKKENNQIILDDKDT